MMTSNKEKALVLLDALAESDREKMAAVCQSDFVWTLVPASMGMEPLVGDAAIDFLSTIAGTHFKAGSLKSKVLRSVEGGDDVVFELNVKATTMNGKQYDNLYVMWFAFREGLISELREHTDTKYAADIMDLDP